MNWRTLVFIVGAVVSVGYALAAPDSEGFQDPGLARIIFFHLPCAFIATGFIVLSAWFGYRYMATGERRFDARNTAATELGALFAALTMATGVLFSRVQWGQWWQNDPRQTSFLVVLLLLVAGVALRAGLSDEQKAAKASAAYSVATVLPGLFLIFVLPRILQSFHPSDTITSGRLSGSYWIGVLLVFAVLVAAARTLYSQRTLLEEKRHEHDADSARIASPHPRRPVAVPRVGTEEDR